MRKKKSLSEKTGRRFVSMRYVGIRHVQERMLAFLPEEDVFSSGRGFSVTCKAAKISALSCVPS